jgi:hypothetical protein
MRHHHRFNFDRNIPVFLGVNRSRRQRRAQQYGENERELSAERFAERFYTCLCAGGALEISRWWIGA